MRSIDEQIQQQRLAEDTRILQRVNAVHRDAFVQKYPGLVQHSLRLLTERLQAGLDKRSGVQVSDVKTWLMTPQELRDLAEAMYYLDQIHRNF